MSIASYFKLVEQQTLDNVHEASLNLLSNTGIVFNSDECVDIFKSHGARVDGHTVYLPEAMVNHALEAVPPDFTWEARNPDRTIRVNIAEPGIHVSLNSGPVYIQDLDHGRRMGTEQDLVNLYKLAQHSDTCTIVGQIPVNPSDITHPFRHLDIFHHLLAQSDKPLFGYVGSTEQIAQMFDLMKLSLGYSLEDDRVFDKHRIAVSLNPLSPLRYDDIPCETLLAYARAGQPIMILTCAMAGVTAPVNPMGTVVLQNTEILAGLVLAQLVKPGTPVVYSPASAVPDLRTAAYMTGLPVSNMINMVGIQMARECYKLPTRCMAGLTDAKIPDCQAGYETMQNYLMLAMAGVDMVNECFGILDSVMTVSYEKFILDDEIMARTAQLLKGIDNFEPDYSVSAISKTGHGGSYLMDASTLTHCRNFWTPPVSIFDSYEAWAKKGALEALRNANKAFKDILFNCPDQVIEPDIDRDLAEYIDRIKE